MAAAQLRAPLYEDKVVDFLFGRAEITDRETTREELEAAIESEDGFATGTHLHSHDGEEDGHVHGPGCGHDHAEEAAPAEIEPVKKPRAKKAKAEEAPAAEAAEQPVLTEGAPTPKKPRAKKAAPVEAETSVLESDPAASEAALGSGDAEALAPAKKPRAKKKAAEG
jgi:trigger factor